MEISKLNKTLKLLENLNCKEIDMDRNLAEIVINYLQIPYLRVDSNEKLLTDILGIETRKVFTNIYRVEKVINRQIDYIDAGDFVIAPRKISKSCLLSEGTHIKDVLYLIKIRDGTPAFLEKEVEVNLRANRTRCVDREHWRYIKVDNFSNFNIKNVETNRILVIDLRCNRGGKIIEMKSVYEGIYGSKLQTYQNIKKEYIDFRSIPTKDKKPTFLIIDKTTCSSAELFAGLGQAYEGAVLVGTKMYGKDVICKRKLIDDMIVHIPEKKFMINGQSPVEITPTYRVDDICEYNEEQILTLCQQLERQERERR